MPRKVFAVNEILTAADVNDLLMDQTVMSFAGTAERGTAIASPSEGMVSYLEDSGHLEIYGGTATGWVSARTSALGSAVAGDSLVYDGTQWLNGPRSGNAIINGDFGVWQRGTSFSSNSFTADRWRFDLSGATGSVLRETFTPADIEAIGYGDAEFFLRLNTTVADDFTRLEYKIEDVRTLAGQQVTLSFWLKSDASGIRAGLSQQFGSGGSSNVNHDQTFTPTNSWVRYSFTYDLGSMAGKTIGSGSALRLAFQNPNNETFTLDLWGVQLEAGPVATPFKLAGGGSKAAELALCQRYYYVHVDGASKSIAPAAAYSSSSVFAQVYFLQTMRTAPSAEIANVSGAYELAGNGVNLLFDDFSVSRLGPQSARLKAVGVSAVQGYAYFLETDTSSARIAFDAEL